MRSSAQERPFLIFCYFQARFQEYLFVPQMLVRPIFKMQIRAEKERDIAFETARPRQILEKDE